MFDPVIAPSGTLLGLLQRGRGDGTLHALTAPRAEALAALNHCVLNDPRHDWQVENRSLYYARLFLDLRGELDEIERHLFAADDVLETDESRTGLSLAVLGHLASYGRRDAFALLRRYAACGTNWAWALDELALRDDDAGLSALALPVLARFPATPEGDAELATAVRDAFEPRPWRLWADDPREAIAARVRAAGEKGSFDRWQRQLTPTGPRPGWSVQAVFDWAQQGIERGSMLHVPAARCLTAVAGPDDRPAIIEAARSGNDGARCTALRYLASAQDPAALDLIEAAVDSPSRLVVDAAVDAFERMRSVAAVERARRWAGRPDILGAAAGRMLACRGGMEDGHLVIGALREAVRSDGPDAATLGTLIDGTGRLGIACAAPVLRHIYRETASSHLRGRAARALAVTDPSFAAGFAVECLWDCEESTRELAARHAATGDARVVDQLRRLASDPAEEAEVQTAVRSRIGPDTPAV
ncbi:HEAT repeat domain-containing protein [Streptomyces himalayensis]|uniref:HEAT repeat domain-containing protein n=1 Tax=Streptomyces himalayensis subsp. himalayensis TaxID=2756131 RepID=A0A7W0DK11_9ACTN|nr:HEAT repeat domain-containing protein [Streptomyces himalayensis]MBA2946185.1 HEAT repeat domain-containing protein [Streptomyces himalayensis subsp. himalayensis]